MADPVSPDDRGARVRVVTGFSIPDEARLAAAKAIHHINVEGKVAWDDEIPAIQASCKREAKAVLDACLSAWGAKTERSFIHPVNGFRARSIEWDAEKSPPAKEETRVVLPWVPSKGDKQA